MPLDNKAIRIALVICIYNRDKYLPGALKSMKNQTFDNTQFQLIIVDNNSTNNAADISKEFNFQKCFFKY